MNRRLFTWLLATCLVVAAVAPALADTADELASQAQDALSDGNSDKALSLLTEAQAKDPRNHRVQALLGRAFFQRGDLRSALEHCNQAVRLNPEDTSSRIMAETISQFPLPGRPAKETAPAPPRPGTLAGEAKAERQALLAQGPFRQGQGPFRLLIDPGHGGIDPGAPGGGLRESDVSLDIALRLARVLAGHGQAVAVNLTRTADVSLPGWARAALAAFYDADLVLSIHAARVPEPAATGLALFTFGRQPSDAVAGATARLENAAHESRDPSSGRLGGQFFATAARRAADAAGTARAARAAGLMAASLGQASPLPVRPPASAPFRLLDESGGPAILVEAGSLSHPADAAILAGADKRQALAEALARAVLAVATAGQAAVSP
ncbi:MAG: N-acetylmuramoyl-L-alanine amidase [Solidesulfovibrio sp. DCME]|uniref:N-acetylmuramoyl-L-alanine amidase n=1 Tax=Solidesulfovibrio sp. DCME TaxID=3447380 RepID=UPI003D13CE40